MHGVGWALGGVALGLAKRMALICTWPKQVCVITTMIQHQQHLHMEPRMGPMHIVLAGCAHTKGGSNQHEVLCLEH